MQTKIVMIEGVTAGVWQRQTFGSHSTSEVYKFDPHLTRNINKQTHVLSLQH